MLLPRPILPQQRSYVDKLVEYVVGDGPNNRYALICRQCDSHNGMALKEEFEFFGWFIIYFIKNSIGLNKEIFLYFFN